MKLKTRYLHKVVDVGEVVIREAFDVTYASSHLQYTVLQRCKDLLVELVSAQPLDNGGASERPLEGHHVRKVLIQ